MRGALASAAQQPLHVAARLTGEIMHQAEEVAASDGYPEKEGVSAASTASASSQEAGNSEFSHGFAGAGRGDGCPDEKAAEMAVSFDGNVTSSVPGMSALDGPDISGSGIHTYKHYRGVLLVLWIAEMVALAMLTQEFVLKITDVRPFECAPPIRVPPDGAYRNKSIPLTNVVFGSLCWAALTATILIYIVRKPRRRKLAVLLFTELVVQWINVSFFLVPNINLLARPCDVWFILVPYCAIVRWTCWNIIFLITVIQAHNMKPYWRGEAKGFTEWFASQTSADGFVRKCLGKKGPFKETMGRHDGILGRFEGSVIDAPWTVHDPKLILWHLNPAYQIYKRDECVILNGDVRCKNPNTQVALSVVMMSWSFLYFGLYLFYLLDAVSKLKTLPRQDHKMVNLSLRVRLLVVAFYTLVIPLLWYVRINSCRSYMYTWYGLLPLQVVETAAAVTWSFFAMPSSHMDDDTPALQVCLQEFAWTEDEKAAKIERRNRDGPKGRQLAKEPMFCFEFAMNMLYWSTLVYNYGEVERGLTLDVGMKLFRMEHSELFWEKALDTKLLMAWNNSRKLIAFRGTASLANALADVQVPPLNDNFLEAS
ncbi:hypothetical protein COCOBI_17-3130 [Coccomyxa sp. Obi]|nr:hypothetical protein COCOBI_17-3130 [Coccomyxa sp. Obi]